MRRRAAALIVGVTLAATVGLVGSGPAAADDPVVTPGSGTVGATDTDTGVALGSEPPAGSTGTGGEPPPGYVVDTFDMAPEGPAEVTDECWGIRLGEAGEAMLRPDWETAAAELAELGDADYIGPCPVEETFDLVAYVDQAWQAEVQPPPPSPLALDPGNRAVTGLAAYLTIGGDPNPTTTLPNPIGPDVVITMTPRYVVSWGEGTTTETTSQGGPHPRGDLTHTYTETGSLTITVEAYWTATWSAGGAGGELPELAEPTEADLAVPVEEYQAVIDPS